MKKDFKKKLPDYLNYQQTIIIPFIFLPIGEIVEYSRAVTPQVRQAGNRLSGLTETAYASLLA